MTGSFTAKDQNGKNIWLFYTGMKDFSKIMPGEIYKDQHFNSYVITRVDYPASSSAVPTNIYVMEHLQSEKQSKFLCLDSTNLNSVYSVAQLEELLLPLGFKIVFK